MKRSSLLLATSLLVNIGLAVALSLRPPATSTRPADEAIPGARGTREETANSAGDAGAPRRANAAAQRAPQPGIWSQVYTDDYDELATRLRQAGFPPRDVRLMIMELREQRYAAARETLRGRDVDVPYWRVAFDKELDVETRAKLSELDDERSSAMRRNLFSAEALAEEEEVAAVVRRRFGDLPVPTLQELWRTEGYYSHQRQEIFRAMRADGRRELNGIEREKLAQLDQEKRRELRQRMTAQEFEDFELRSSDTANRLRSQLDVFQPSEAEYRALFELQRPIDEQFTEREGNDEKQRPYREALEALKPQIEAALGPERYADYLQAADRGSDKLNRLMVRLELPLSTVGKVDAVQKEITQRATAVQADPRISLAQREAQLAALAEEAETKLTAALGGSRGYRVYEDVTGEWIRALRVSGPIR